MDDERQPHAGTGINEDALAAYMKRPWQAHYSASVSATVSVPEQPLTWLIDEAARKYGANIAIEYYGTRLTYLQLASLVERFARALAQLGIKRGDRISICLPNTPQFPIAFYGALKAGAVVVPTNPLYTPPELEHQLKDSGARAIVMLDQFYPAFAPIRERTPVEHVPISTRGATAVAL